MMFLPLRRFSVPLLFLLVLAGCDKVPAFVDGARNGNSGSAQTSTPTATPPPDDPSGLVWNEHNWDEESWQ